MSRHFLLAPLLLGTLCTSASAASTALTFPFKSMLNSGTPSGQLSVRALSPQSSVSVMTLRGLTPNRAYAAHYHALGSASKDPCASQGPITLGFPAFKANAQGQATVLLRSDPARINGALGAYVNVHTASDLTVVPLCAAVLKVSASQMTPAMPAATPAPAAATPVMPAAATPATSARQSVKIGDNVFVPAALTVAAGTTVTWTHGGQVTHNVVSLNVAGLRSPDLGPGDSYSYTFKTPGTYSYYCSYHEGMSGTITVTNR